ncbi:hypothetical protein [Nostoc sp.]
MVVNYASLIFPLLIEGRSLGFLSTRRSMRSLEWVGRSRLFHE